MDLGFRVGGDLGQAEADGRLVHRVRREPPKPDTLHPTESEPHTLHPHSLHPTGTCPHLTHSTLQRGCIRVRETSRVDGLGFRVLGVG